MAHRSNRRLADSALVQAVLDQAEARLDVTGGSAGGGAAAGALTRSHTSDFRTVGWYGIPPPGWRLAIDAEVSDAPVPPALAARFGPASFWSRWTRAESMCKVFGVPIAVWLRRHGLGVPARFPGAWRTLALADLTISVACVPAAVVDRGAG
ncbi:MAG TPA: hypothetical protein VF462_12130 [Micromonosporaceae bacterium]